MSRLVAEIAKCIRDRMRHVARTLPTGGKLRSVFHGPPLPYMQDVLAAFQQDGLDAQLGDGENVTIPVLLPVDGEQNAANPLVGQSGRCDDSHILSLRNTPACPRFLTLAVPARHSMLSVEQATDAFGLTAANNGASVDISEWWDDSFIVQLRDAALARVQWAGAEQTQASTLLTAAVVAADQANRHDPRRLTSWASLSRVFSLSAGDVPLATQWSLACGVPRTQDGRIDSELQLRALQQFVEALVDEGFDACLTRLKRTASPDECQALDDCVRHLENGCEVRTALARAPQYYFAPFRDNAIGEAPSWWMLLSAERLAALLEDDVAPQGAIAIRCTNSVVASGNGLPPVVADGAAFEVALPDDAATLTPASVSRMSSGKGSQERWSLDLHAKATFRDDQIPSHRQPLRYVVEAAGFRSGSARVVSLAHWEPGIVVSCRSATKVTLPKKARQGSGLECLLTMSGEGRHYLELHTSPGTSIDTEIRGEDTSTSDERLEATLTHSGEATYGLELVATPECKFALAVTNAAGIAQSFVIHLTCEELPVEGCRSEFERLIRLNRQGGRATSVAVQLDTQIRTADLEGWQLDGARVSRSFYPLVIGTDCRDKWGAPGWRTPSDTVLSRGTFLHDPRPASEDFLPPPAWIDARERIAARLRGDDGYGLIEAAEFAIWMKAPEWVDLVNAYVKLYLDWLAAAPDIAAWVDVAIVCGLEADGRTLAQEPEALIFSPLHPLKIGWHCLAHRTLEEAVRLGAPCPSASILDPDGVPDSLALPLRTPSGAIRRVMFLSTECSSDYWSVLWNGSKLSALSARGDMAPFDDEFGIRLGGVSSGFSASQVGRALDDVSVLMSAKPTLNVLVSSSTGHSDACNVGLTSWARESFASEDSRNLRIGQRRIHVFDERRAGAPEHAELANLAEDTDGAVTWYRRMGPEHTPDLGIVAQLETSNADTEPSDVGTPLGIGALIRHRIRTQLRAGSGAFLCESRVGLARPPSGDGLADAVMNVAARLENQAEERRGYTFAPSVTAISSLLKERRAEYVAVSSSAVDPSCFLGGWLEDAYLWDYELPSYSRRSGDTNGYYLLSQVKAIDSEVLHELLKRLPGCNDLDEGFLKALLLEVAGRGIPTVRGLSTSNSGAAGDLGLFLAGRLLQDEFRRDGDGPGSLLKMVASDGLAHELTLVLPVDPFRAYLFDLHRAISAGPSLRPDLVVAAIVLTDSTIKCKLTPVEVKYRRDVMAPGARVEALGQATALSDLLATLRDRASRQDLLMWKLSLQHLLLSMLDFGFRVYSQKMLASQEWTALHQRVMAAILSDELILEIDKTGRLIVFDASTTSGAHDLDGDGQSETMVLSPADAAAIAKGPDAPFYEAIRRVVADWGMFPGGATRLQHAMVTSGPASPVESTPEPETVAAGTAPPALQRAAPLPQANGAEDVTSTARAAGPPISELREPLRVFVGETVDGFRVERRFLCPSDTALNQLNMGVVGDLGTGKTQLLKSLILQISRATESNGGVRPRFLIFDYKKDYSSADFVKAVGARVVRPQLLPLNIFDTTAVSGELVPWMSRYRFFADVLDKIYSNVGPVQRENLKESVKQACQDAQTIGRQATIYDVHERYRQRVQGKTDSPLAIISDVVDMQLFSHEPSQGSEFGAFFDGVVVLSLDALGQDDKTKNMLVAFMLNMFYEHMLKIPKRAYVGTKPQLRTVDSYLLVDEADNIMRYEFDVLSKILLQGREFGVGVILASQYLKHFRAGATDYREPLLSWFIHKVPNISPQELSAIGLTGQATQMADRIRQLGNHQCLFKTFDVPGEIVQGMPFYKLVADE